MSDKNRAKKKSPFLSILLLILIGIFLFSSYMVISDLWQKHKEQAAFDQLAETAEESENISDNDAAGESSADSSADAVDYSKLTAMNSDFAGWLRIPGTDIDYPVMYTPDDPEYYLHRAFDKSQSSGNSIHRQKLQLQQHEFYSLWS